MNPTDPALGILKEFITRAWCRSKPFQIDFYTPFESSRTERTDGIDDGKPSQWMERGGGG